MFKAQYWSLIPHELNIVTTNPMKMDPIMKKTAQPTKMALVPTQPINIAPSIPKILQRIMNKILWIITLQTRHQ